MEVKTISKLSGAPTVRSMATSFVVHLFLAGGLMLIPAQVLLRSAPPNKELDIVFYRPPEIGVRPRAAALPVAKSTNEPGSPAPARKPIPNAPAGPDRTGSAELPPGPEVGFPVEPKPEPKVGKTAGI